jgi:ATP-dependent Clp protease ATP-binding subunit ClpA
VFERFALAARLAVADARNEAGRAGHDKIRSEHLLIGLLAEPSHAADAMTAAGLTMLGLRAALPPGKTGRPTGMDADALSTLGIDLDAVRRATNAAFGPGALDRVVLPGRSRFQAADDTKQALAGALHRAVAQGHKEISAADLLVSILDLPRSGALDILTAAGIDVPALRADVLRRTSDAA